MTLMSEAPKRWSVGAVWRRWDPHLHAPGTLLEDQFKGDWNAYLTAIETSSPRIEALGVTDYFCIRTYKAVCKWKEEGRLPDVRLIFPNVELRLDVKTDKAAINLHLLFAPDDPEHVAAIERVLGLLQCTLNGRIYTCNETDLAGIGRLINSGADPEAALRLGAGQFKVKLEELRTLYGRDAWLRENCLIAVAGSNNDGTAGLQSDDSFKLVRREIEQFADMIFASTPKQREFWLGKGADDVAKLERLYRGRKPCLHGSDAHRAETVGKPQLDRYCWIKGDPTFEALRQVVIEPEDRVSIGSTVPDGGPSPRISSVQVADAPWLRCSEMTLNEGLVAIIGERGSGKTALADMIARGARAEGAGTASASFLRRAGALLGDSRVLLTWRDGTVETRRLRSASTDEPEDRPADVRYLSQQFVDGLCSAAGLATELREEIERVVFDASDESQRMGASGFADMADVWLEPPRRRREELRELIRDSAASIQEEDQLRAGLAKVRSERADLEKKLAVERRSLETLIPKGQEERAKQLSVIEADCSQVERLIEELRLRRKRIADLAAEVEHIRTNVEASRFRRMQTTFAAAELTGDDWSAFAMGFTGDVDGILKRRGNELDDQIKKAIEGDPGNPSTYEKDGSLVGAFLNELRTRREALRKAVGIDAQQQKEYERLRALIQQMDTTLRRLDTRILHASGADARRTALIATRRQHYLDVFTTFVEEERTLATLYSPLGLHLANAGGAASKLKLVVKRRIDLDSWVGTGEELLDLRASTKFRGHGKLRAMAEQDLLQAWSTGTATTVADAMDGFRTAVADDVMKSIPARLTTPEQKRDWMQQVATWLYSTEHVSIVYDITYDGVAIEQLSPGTRGIVLLLLFLVIDRSDLRPLIVDQPEENLDPKSVFDELVPHFRQVRKNRQVIIVTHNANLVVNTDADQVIVAESHPAADGGLPAITYWSGSLETKEVRSAVCSTLEGGERAFLEREKRYRIQRPDVVIIREASSKD